MLPGRRFGFFGVLLGQGGVRVGQGMPGLHVRVTGFGTRSDLTAAKGAKSVETGQLKKQLPVSRSSGNCKEPQDHKEAVSHCLWHGQWNDR